MLLPNIIFMKYVKWLALGCIALSNVQCEAQNTEKISNNPPVNSFKKSIINKIELRETTRGSNRIVILTPASKNINLNGSIKNFKNDQWQDAEKIVSKIPLEKISTYPAPTTERFSDGALISNIKVTTSDGAVYESQSFDSGKPPQELADLYRMLSSSFKPEKF